MATNLGTAPNISLGTGPNINLGTAPQSALQTTPYQAIPTGSIQSQLNSLPTQMSVAPVVKAQTQSIAPAQPSSGSSGTLGSYKGNSIYAGQDVAQQMAAIDAQQATKLQPQTYNVGTPANTYDSTMTGNGSNAQTLNQTLQDKGTQYLNGTNPALTGSDALMQQIFEKSQYTPEEQTALQNIATAQSDAYTGQLAQRRQIEQMQQNGDITQDQAKAMINDTITRTDRQIADATGNQSYYTNQLGVLSAIRGNSLDAYKTLFDMTKGSTTLSPGQGLYSATGQQVAGASGVAPQITSLATQLYQQALTTGNVATDANGQPDMGAYMQQASQLTGIPLPANSGASLYSSSGQGYSTQGGGNSQQSNVPYTGQPSGQPAGYGQSGYGNVSMIPQNLQQYVQNTTVSDAQGNISNLPFINSARVPAALQATAQSKAAAAGIPYVDGTGVNAIMAAQQIIDVVNQAEALAIRNLKPGVGGRISNTLTNWANNILQFNPDLSNFAQLKDAASKSTTALAGGVGSGFRMNQAVIDNAVSNMPTASDNLESAMTKAEALRGQILNAIAPLYPQLQGGSIFSGNYTASNPTGSKSNSGSSAGGSGWASLGD